MHPTWLATHASYTQADSLGAWGGIGAAGLTWMATRVDSRSSRGSRRASGAARSTSPAAAAAGGSSSEMSASSAGRRSAPD